MIRILSLTLLFFIAIGCNNADSKEKGKKKKDKKGRKTENVNSETAAAHKTEAEWELPPFLKEISGISLIDESRVVCVQDEFGTLFIYDLNSSKVTSEIKFAGKGDFEALAIVGTTAYALRADGVIFMIENYEKSNSSQKQFSMNFGMSQDAEGICYDAAHNRLLVVGKGIDPAFETKKGVYAFNLTTKTVDKTPVFAIDLEDKMFKTKKKLDSVIQPSDIGIHPSTKEYYITDRGNNQLAIFDAEGTLKKVVPLDKNTFAAPEGIAFSVNGDIYISNEFGKNKPATIVKLAPGAFN